MKHRIIHCLACGALGLALTIPASAQWSDSSWRDGADLPSLAADDSKAVTGEEFKLGRAWLRQFRSRAPGWDDLHAQAYMEALIDRLVPHSGLGNTPILVTLVDNRNLNAFAVPGGVVGINAGLFAFADTEAELTSVLAHELGHLSQRHYARGQARAEQTQIPAMAAMLAGMLIAAGGGVDAGIGLAMGSQAALIQSQLSFSRRFEEEADRIGLQAMAKAGYDPNAMVMMLRGMQRMASLQGGNPPEFLLTHPVTESRISDSQDRATTLEVVNPRNEGIRYQLIRARALLRVHDRDPRQAATRLAEGDAPEDARRYLEALIAADAGNTDDALRILDTLAGEHPDLAIFPASAVEVVFDAGRYEDAIERSRRQLRLMPGHVPTTRLLGEALLQRDPDEAWRVLSDLANRRPEDPQVFTLLAEAAGRSGRKALGHLYRAEQMQLTGRIDDAIHQLDVAKRVAEGEGNSVAVSRIAQRREAFLGYRETLEKF